MGLGAPDQAGAGAEFVAVAVGVTIVADHRAGGGDGLAPVSVGFAPVVEAGAERRGPI